MIIAEILKANQPKVHKELNKLRKEQPEPKKDIPLGDSVENLMKADSHKRVRGALIQRSWG